MSLPSLLLACAHGAGGPRPSEAPQDTVEAIRLLYDGRSESGTEAHRFRLAVALAPPDRLRLELLPPVGGPRLVVTAAGGRLLALDPAHRRAEVWEPESAGVARLLGAALGAAELRTLLEGRSPCSGDPAPPADCPFGGGVYRARDDGGDASARRAALLEKNGTLLLDLAYPSAPPAAGEFVKSIEIRRPAEASILRLVLTSGPQPAPLATSLFSTEPPERFERGAVLGREGLSAAVTGENGK